jgi:hypothetical protein
LPTGDGIHRKGAHEEIRHRRFEFFAAFKPSQLRGTFAFAIKAGESTTDFIARIDPNLVLDIVQCKPQTCGVNPSANVFL